MTEINYYRYSGIPQVINKNIQFVRSDNVKVNQEFGYMSPVLKLTSEYLVEQFKDDRINYVEIEGKYYYIVNWNITHSGVIEVSLYMDVLMSYKDEIGNMRVILERSDREMYPDMTDPMIPISNTRGYQRIPFPIKFEDGEEYGTFLLVSSQSGYSAV